MFENIIQQIESKGGSLGNRLVFNSKTGSSLCYHTVSYAIYQSTIAFLIEITKKNKCHFFITRAPHENGFFVIIHPTI